MAEAHNNGNGHDGAHALLKNGACQADANGHRCSPLHAEFIKDIFAGSIDGGDDAAVKIIEAMHRPPPLTTLRVSPFSGVTLEEAKNMLERLIEKNKNHIVAMTSQPFVHPEFDIWEVPAHFPNTFFISCKNNEDIVDIKDGRPFVIVDRATGQSVLRGANVYIPGIKTIDPSVQTKNSVVHVYADIDDLCLDGQKLVNLGRMTFVGTGVIAFSRDHFYKGKKSLASEDNVGVYVVFSKYPSLPLSNFHPDVFFLQNIPSMMASMALGNAGNMKIILDACSGYGGKTTHLAALYHPAIVVAVERSKRKAEACRRLARSMGLSDSIICIRGDLCKLKPIDLVNKIIAEKPSLAHCLEDTDTKPIFDAVLLDPPCSGIGTVTQIHPYA